MKLILSTDGTAKPNQHDLSTAPEIEVSKVDEIGKVTTIYGPPTHGKRDVVYVELSPVQALGVALDILTRLALDHGTVASWNISFPEPEEAPEEQDDEELLERVYGVPRPHPCVNGHFDCATTEGGSCANELYAALLAKRDEDREPHDNFHYNR